jgi:hypothetical protein
MRPAREQREQLEDTEADHERAVRAPARVEDDIGADSAADDLAEEDLGGAASDN